MMLVEKMSLTTKTTTCHRKAHWVRLFPSTPNATVAESSLDDSPVDDAQRSGDSMTIGTVPETSLDELQGDADESDVTVTEKSTGINHTAQVGPVSTIGGR